MPLEMERRAGWRPHGRFSTSASSDDPYDSCKARHKGCRIISLAEYGKGPPTLYPPNMTSEMMS